MPKSGKLPSAVQHNFSQVPNADIPRSRFDRTHGIKTTLDAGYLVPIFVDDALPGDTFSMGATLFGRLATPLHPIMDNMYLDIFWFAVPLRLVWSNFQRFMGEQPNPGDSTDFLVPVVDVTAEPALSGYANGSLFDYFGIPTEVPALEHMSLPLRAYNLIYNEWFRDQNLQDSLEVPLGDGPDDPAIFNLVRRGKRHDYFTSALPWPQKGPAVSLPLGTTAPVLGIGKVNQTYLYGPNVVYETGGTTATTYQSAALFDAGTTDNEVWLEQDPDNTGFPRVVADLSAATAATINELRLSFQMQKLYERDARGGTRYTEIIRAHFGVVSPDARLQRPEYLGGGSSPINVMPVPQTSETTTESPLGELGAYGTFSVHGNGFSKSFTEHSIVIGLVSIRADLNYQQGLPRMWSRSTKFDFYWPALSHIGEQAVLNKEIYAQGSADLDADAAVFGYQERWAEYRYKPNQITGQFRSNYTQSLDTWHLAQDFGTLPVLGPTFIVENPPVGRVIAVEGSPQFLLDGFLQMTAARPMPMYSVPGLIDHF